MYMGLIKGITIELLKKEKIGVDEFNAPIFDITSVLVPNVIVTPSDASDVVDVMNLTGKKAVYSLCIPNGDANDWTNAEVVIWGEKYRTIGIPKEYIKTPLEWNKQIKVERIE